MLSQLPARLVRRFRLARFLALCLVVLALSLSPRAQTAHVEGSLNTVLNIPDYVA